MGDAIKDRLLNNRMAIVLVRKAVIFAFEEVLIKLKTFIEDRERRFKAPRDLIGLGVIQALRVDSA